MKVFAGILGCAAVLALPSAASGRAPIPTHIVVIGGALRPSGDAAYYGYLTSPNPKCLSGRTLKWIIKFDDGSKSVVDTATTSRHGYWGTGGPVTFPSGSAMIVQNFFRASAKHFGPRGHRKTCAAANGLPTPI
jgi:hypothetical protein